MCELLAMSSRRVTRLTISFETLASHGASTNSTRDGWGVAYYGGNDVMLFREPAAAGDSALVRFLETQSPRTALAISHIRRATRGGVALSNTQPFVRELAGRMHVFAHNGDLPGIERRRRLTFARYRPVGTTDSEHAFCALLERVHDLWQSASHVPPLGKRLSAVSQFAAELRRLGPANFLYADGDALFAHGHRRIQPLTGEIAPPGLFVLCRRCIERDQRIEARGVGVGPGYQEVVLIASVPLSDEKWRALAEGEVIAVSGGHVVSRRSSQRSTSALVHACG
ncbi:MAG: class II glutamine amidotransferase [Betaproteobacteria bacterium RIFCSPLOWO2_12_FULL_62_58]|nr:MAG: class II glutamine amidotransferase [Betaproteobacteria bacterium RIFCSPLOWO2_12_FULL_62_58]